MSDLRFVLFIKGSSKEVESLAKELQSNLMVSKFLAKTRFAKRKDAGGRGIKRGNERTIALIANHFPMTIAKRKIQHYDVSIMPMPQYDPSSAAIPGPSSGDPQGSATTDERPTAEESQGRRLRMKKLNSMMNFKVIKTVKDESDSDGNPFNDITIAFDGQRNLLTTAPVKIMAPGQKEISYQIDVPGDGRKLRYSVSLKVYLNFYWM